MRAAFIGHTFHRKTKSSRFWVELLERNATVEQWYGEPDSAPRRDWGSRFDESNYDVIVIWQLHEAFELLSGRHPNVVFVPMYDAMFWAGEFYWKEEFNAAKVLCFSWALRREVMRRGAVHAGAQYFPDPAQYANVDDFETLRGFLWYRRREITPNLVFRLCRGTTFDRFTIHDAPDPGHETAKTWVAPANIGRLAVSRWSEDSDNFAAGLRQSNVFFAPRPSEGIGMSVLEAMAAGLCVVAPDAPTMNEYIANGTNGLLYVPGRRAALDFSEAARIGARARESIERGHQRWQTSLPALLDFVATPTAALRKSGRILIPVLNEFASPTSVATPPRRLVTVVTVCRNAAAELEATMLSVLGQVGCDFEYLVIDGLSTDGSLDIIDRYKARLAAWRSEADGGAYDAMNNALELARGEFVLFMNAGDSFASEDALRRMFSNAPEDADVVFGHHIYRLADGTEELHHAAEFETTWTRLQTGDLWFDWLAGIPCHQATAVRRDLLRRLRFAPQYRIAADHDVMFRARAEGARFHNSDEVIAVYVAGGFSAQQYARCRQEWAQIARTHGDAAASDRFYAQLEAVSTGHAAPGAPARVRGLALRAIGMLRHMSPALAGTAERAMRSPRVRRLARRIAPGLFARPVEAAPWHADELEEGIDFSQPGLPEPLAGLEGMSHAEPWGRWTVGPVTELRFRGPLPATFDMELEAHAFGANADLPVQLRLGASRVALRIGAQTGICRVFIANPGGGDTLLLRIPRPMAPAKLWPGASADRRRLGLALIRLRIIAATAGSG